MVSEKIGWIHESCAIVKDNKTMRELSIVFLTYNANIDEARESLDSLISQEGVDFEIIVTDDGSENNNREELETYFREKQFRDYKLVMNPVNKGTAANLLSGLMKAEGEYVKTLSPGDRLIDVATMKNWLDFMKKNGSDWSFSDAVYYHKDVNGIDEIITAEAHPQDIAPYLNGDKERCRWNYVALQDLPVGATILSRTCLQIDYCRRILDAGVIYAEDNMWRLLMFEGNAGIYYPHETVLYECGSGISAAPDGVWKERLLKDWKAADSLMLDIKDPDGLQRAMLRAIRDNQNAFQKMFIKGKLRLRLKRRFRKRMTKCR